MDKIFDIVKKEKNRQEEFINLIASENYAPKEILELAGSVLTNKYAEGLPGKRYYGGTKFVDEAENLAIERAKKLFGAEHANVQPHSGTQANMAAYMAFLKPGDKVLAQSLMHGGHLTHGHPANFSGKLYKFMHYGVDPKTHLLDYQEIQKLAKKHKPKMIIAGYSAYSRKLDFNRFRKIADGVGAILIADIAHLAGLIAGGVFPDPVPFADIVTSTTQKTLRGPRGGFILCKKEYAKVIDSAVFPMVQGGPLEHIIAAKALSFKLAGDAKFKKYAAATVANAKELATVLNAGGLEVLTGGTDNHMMLIDVKKSVGITGKEAEAALESAGIVTNKNTIPFDTESAFVTSGIRLGTAAVTTRGMGYTEIRMIAGGIIGTLNNMNNKSVHKKIGIEMKKLAKKFPVYL